MTWNKKNQQFALSCGLRPSAFQLMMCLLRKGNPNKVVEVEIDLRAENRWIGKHRPQGEFDRKTVKSALWQLDEKTKGMILVSKSYTWAIHKVIIRPLEIVLKENSQSGDSLPRLNRGNPMFSEKFKNRAKDLLLQNISKLDSLLKKLGMKCNLETLHRMWLYSGRSMENVASAVEYMLRVNKNKIESSTSFEKLGEGLKSPIGWLHDCLKYGRYIDCDENIELPNLNQFDSIMQLVRDCNRLGDRMSSTA